MSVERRRSIERKIMRFMHNRARPVYLGEISNDIGYDLERTCTILEEMTDEGNVRRLTTEEKTNLGHDLRADLWIILASRQLDDDGIF